MFEREIQNRQCASVKLYPGYESVYAYDTIHKPIFELLILFPISLLLSILTAFLTFILGIGTTILYFLMLMCIVATIRSFMQKNISLGYPGGPGGYAWVYRLYVDYFGELPVVEVPGTPTPRVHRRSEERR